MGLNYVANLSYTYSSTLFTNHFFIFSQNTKKLSRSLPLVQRRTTNTKMKITLIATLACAGFVAAAPKYTPSHGKTDSEISVCKHEESHSSNLDAASTKRLLPNLDFLKPFPKNNCFQNPTKKPLFEHEDAASKTGESDKILDSRTPAPPRIPFPPFSNHSSLLDIETHPFVRYAIKNMTLFEELTRNVTELKIYLQTTDPKTLREVAAEIFPEEYISSLDDMSDQDIRDVVAELSEQQIEDFVAGMRPVEARDIVSPPQESIVSHILVFATTLENLNLRTTLAIIPTTGA